ncbi:MAG: hypothetical protein N2053_08175, partial [Chitinispirillaceae bacterium]|nr:hypothetical protein [Chitinispirillaceae bacterium]
IGQFIKEMGEVGKGDVVFVEKSDHDAGHKPSGENWFWDSTGYAKYFLWTRCIAYKTGLPIVGWQISEGNMSHPNQQQRDNAVETFLAHPEWWVNGGFIGILFGAGNPCCANYGEDNDGGWFIEHISAYHQNPYLLPQTEVEFSKLDYIVECPKKIPILTLFIDNRKFSFKNSYEVPLILFNLSGRRVCGLSELRFKRAPGIIIANRK